MNRPQRRALTLVMSLVLMIFSICQAQARAALPTPSSAAGHAAHGAVMSHHQASEHASHTAPADCHGDCLHLTAHPDAGSTAQLPDLTPVLLAWLPPVPLQDAVISRALAYQPPSARAADPPVTLRFQRFLN